MIVVDVVLFFLILLGCVVVFVFVFVIVVVFVDMKLLL